MIKKLFLIINFLFVVSLVPVIYIVVKDNRSIIKTVAEQEKRKLKLREWSTVDSIINVTNRQDSIINLMIIEHNSNILYLRDSAYTAIEKQLNVVEAQKDAIKQLNNKANRYKQAVMLLNKQIDQLQSIVELNKSK